MTLEISQNIPNLLQAKSRNLRRSFCKDLGNILLTVPPPSINRGFILLRGITLSLIETLLKSLLKLSLSPITLRCPFHDPGRRTCLNQSSPKLQVYVNLLPSHFLPTGMIANRESSSSLLFYFISFLKAQSFLKRRSAHSRHHTSVPKVRSDVIFFIFTGYLCFRNRSPIVLKNPVLLGRIELLYPNYYSLVPTVGSTLSFLQNLSLSLF